MKTFQEKVEIIQNNLKEITLFILLILNQKQENWNWYTKKKKNNNNDSFIHFYLVSGTHTNWKSNHILLHL